MLIWRSTAAGGEWGLPPQPVSPEQNVSAPAAPLDTSPSGESDVIAFEDGIVTVRGVELAFPMQLDELVGVLGSPDRTVNVLNDIHVWDELGILVYCKPGQRQVKNIEVDFTKQDYDFSPHQSFAGEIHFNGGIITAQSTPETLRAAGLSEDADFPILLVWRKPPYSVIAEYTDSLHELSISVSE